MDKSIIAREVSGLSSRSGGWLNSVAEDGCGSVTQRRRATLVGHEELVEIFFLTQKKVEGGTAAIKKYGRNQAENPHQQIQ